MKIFCRRRQSRAQQSSDSPGTGGAGRARVSHLLAQGGDVPGGLDDPLPAVVVLIELVTEGLKHGRVLIPHKRSFGAAALGIAPVVPLLAWHVRPRVRDEPFESLFLLRSGLVDVGHGGCALTKRRLLLGEDVLVPSAGF